jgi:hypothetical protein
MTTKEICDVSSNCNFGQLAMALNSENAHGVDVSFLVIVDGRTKEAKDLFATCWRSRPYSPTSIVQGPGGSTWAWWMTNAYINQKTSEPDSILVLTATDPLCRMAGRRRGAGAEPGDNDGSPYRQQRNDAWPTTAFLLVPAAEVRESRWLSPFRSHYSYGPPDFFYTPAHPDRGGIGHQLPV